VSHIVYGATNDSLVVPEALGVLWDKDSACQFECTLESPSKLLVTRDK
jgi:hypothetical protein